MLFTTPSLFVKAHPLYFFDFFIDPVIQRELLHLGGLKCQPFLKRSGYYVADLTPLILTDFLETFMSLSVFTQMDERILQWTNG